MKTSVIIVGSIISFLVLSIIFLAVFVFQLRVSEREDRYKEAAQEYDWDDFLPPLSSFPTTFPYQHPVLPRVLTAFLVVRKDKQGEPQVFKGPEWKKISAERSLLESEFAQELVPLPILLHSHLEKDLNEELAGLKKNKKNNNKKKGKKGEINKEKRKTKEEIYGQLTENVHFIKHTFEDDLHLGYILLLDPKDTFKVDQSKIQADDVVLYSYSLAGKPLFFCVKDLPKCVVAYVPVSPDGTHFSDFLWISPEEECTPAELNATQMNHIIIRKAQTNPYKHQMDV